jgi:hypothetical protein
MYDEYVYYDHAGGGGTSILDGGEAGASAGKSDEGAPQGTDNPDGDGGGSAGTENTEGSAQAGTTSSQGDAGTQASWYKGLYGEDGKINQDAYERLPEHLKPAAESLKRYNSIEDVFSTLWHQKQALSKGGLTRPEEGAAEEVISEFNEKLRELNGAPKSAAEYDFAPPEDMPDYLKWEDKEAEGIKDVFHKHGINQEAANEIRDIYVQMKSADEAASLDSFKAQEKATLDALGPDKQLLAANALESAAVLGFSAEQAHILTNAAIQAGMGAEFVQGLAGLKNLIGEDKFVSTGQGGSAVMDAGGRNYKDLAMEALENYERAKGSGDAAAADRFKKQEGEYWRLASKAGQA